MTSPRETLSSCYYGLAEFGESENEEDTIVAARKKNDERRSGAKRHERHVG